MIDDDTICAPATPPVNSTLALIRISGPDSLRTATCIFSKPEKIEHRNAVYGSLHEGEHRIDDVILVFYSAPESFSGEDMVEIICHGNQIIVHRILKLLKTKGIRMAEPGEFSKRAFLNGKMDLTEAEAINHVIRAKSEWEVDTALKQMHGSLREVIRKLRESITELKGDIETGIDFIDQEIEIISYSDARKRGEELLEQLKELHLRCRIGEKITHGIDVTITGKPNVGKSSILNLLLNQERAIVSEIPGTTRDMIKEAIHIKGIQLNLIDTAGIDKSRDRIEKIGIELSKEKIKTAALVLMVIDAETGIDEADRKIFGKLKNKRVIYLINKTDIAEEKAISLIEGSLDGVTVRFSAKTGAGLKELEDVLFSMLNREFVDIENSFVADLRVIDLIEKGIEGACRVVDLIERNETIEIVAFELQALLDTMSEITGEITPDDVLNSIFSRFCIGK
jgi:tRNA modification GTPase